MTAELQISDSGDRAAPEAVDTGRITVTERAVNHILREMAKEDPVPLGFRLGVTKTGCSGLAYVVDFVHEARDDDHVFPQRDGLDVYVDEKSLRVIDGLRVDYTREGLTQMLRFQNPNVTGECGCGESFTVE
jgi:iron-sulfur cluster assembly protein